MRVFKDALSLTPNGGIGSKAAMESMTVRPFASPEAAAAELRRIYREQIARRMDVLHTYTGVTNSEFLQRSGGNVAEYAAGRDYGTKQKWFRIDESGTRVFLLPEGAEL